MIKAVCFDLDGVYFTPRGKSSFQTALVEEFDAAPETALHAMTRSAAMAQLVRGQIGSAEFWQQFRALTGITANDGMLAARWIRDYEVDAGVQHAVRRAKQQGYKTCVCTNNNAIRLPPLVDRFELNDDFDVIISSHMVGYTKPEKEIFLALIERLGIEPGELVYADDNPARLQGAAALGIHTFVYKDFAQFLRELKTLGVDLA